MACVIDTTPIDGHFWVVRDGKIIDPNFPQYDMIKKIVGGVGERVYLPAEKIIQSFMIKKYIVGRTMLLTDERNKYIIEMYSPLFAKCETNALVETLKNGGEIVFGSMGWNTKNGGIHYEYGGANWTISQFLKK